MSRGAALIGIADVGIRAVAVVRLVRWTGVRVVDVAWGLAFNRTARVPTSRAWVIAAALSARFNPFGPGAGWG